MKVHGSTEEQKKGLVWEGECSIASFFSWCVFQTSFVWDAREQCVHAAMRELAGKALPCQRRSSPRKGIFSSLLNSTHTRCGLHQIKVFLFLERLASAQLSHYRQEIRVTCGKQILMQSPSRWVLRSNWCWMCMICYCIMATYLLIAR